MENINYVQSDLPSEPIPSYTTTSSNYGCETFKEGEAKELQCPKEQEYFYATLELKIPTEGLNIKSLISSLITAAAANGEILNVSIRQNRW